MTLDVRKWNLGIHNETYYGAGLMPYYFDRDDGDNQYGSDLYFGNPFYRIHKDPETPWYQIGGYNRLMLYYQPYVSDLLDLRIAAIFHYSDSATQGIDLSFQGWQQMFTLIFHLDSSRTRRVSKSF